MTQKFKHGGVFEGFLRAPAPVLDADVATKLSAQGQADAAQAAAVATAAADATAKANAAQAAAEATAAADATTKANAAQSAAIAAAATDATAKADAAQAAAIAAAAADATTKANAAQAAAEATAAADATAKANAALASANAYTDGVRQGLYPKANVKAATTAALPAVTATTTTLTADANGAFPNQDGIAIGLNETVLVKNQLDASQNGPYKLTTAGGAGAPFVLTRTDDFDTSAEAKSGSVVGVQQGATYADQQWQMITDGVIDLGTTGLTWQQMVTGTTITASTGLTKVGNDIQAVTVANRTAITGGAIDVDPDLLPSPLAGDAGKRLIATAADATAWTAIPVAAPGTQGELSGADATALFAIKPVVFQGGIADNQAVAADVDASLNYAPAGFNGAIFDVVMKRGTTNVAIGKVFVTNNDDGSQVTISSQFEEGGDCGVTFSAVFSGGSVRLRAATTNTGFAVVTRIHQVKMKAAA